MPVVLTIAILLKQDLIRLLCIINYFIIQVVPFRKSELLTSILLLLIHDFIDLLFLV